MDFDTNVKLAVYRDFATTGQAPPLARIAPQLAGSINHGAALGTGRRVVRHSALAGGPAAAARRHASDLCPDRARRSVLGSTGRRVQLGAQPDPPLPFAILGAVKCIFSRRGT
jgi:hypothetical protein